MQSATHALGLGSLPDLEFPTFRKAWSHLQDHFVPHLRNNYRPHLLSHRLLALFSLLLLSVKVSVIGALSIGSLAVPAYSSAITAETIISLTNQSRQQQQLASLAPNAQLAQAAQTKASDMAAKGYFSHTAPDGKSPWDFIKAVRYRYLSAGENLAVDFTQAENLETAWMNSPGHRANLLNKDFKEIGIGIAQGQFEGHSTTFVVQMFGQPINDNLVLQDKPTIVVPRTPVAAVPSTPPAVSAPAPVPSSQPAMAITDVSTEVKDGNLQVLLSAPPQTIKVLAQYGGQATMLDAKPDGKWTGAIPVKDLTDKSLRLTASDIAGHAAGQEVGSFASSWQDSYQPPGQVQGEAIKVFGVSLQPKILEQKFYLLFMAAMLACLILAIGIRRHVQHVAMIANTSFVVMLACLLLLSG